MPHLDAATRQIRKHPTASSMPRDPWAAHRLPLTNHLFPRGYPRGTENHGKRETRPAAEGQSLTSAATQRPANTLPPPRSRVGTVWYHRPWQRGPLAWRPCTEEQRKRASPNR